MDAMKGKIVDFVETPRKLFAKHPALRPKGMPLPELTPVDCTVELSGAPTPYTNAIRRVICSEYPVKILACERSAVQTDDEFIIADFNVDRVANIPIRQDVAIGAKFAVKAKAATASNHAVYTGDFTPALPTNTNMTLVSIRGGCYFELTCQVIEAMGYSTSQTNHIGTIATQVVCVPARPPQMYDQYIKIDTEGDAFELDAARGVRSGVSAHTDYLLQFTTLGTAEPRRIVKTACEILAKRFAAVGAAPVIAGSTNILRIDMESMTIGPPMVYAAIELDPTSNMTCSQLATSRVIEIRFLLGRDYSDPAEFISAVCKRLTAYYLDLAGQV
jgi:hypothetical protein